MTSTEAVAHVAKAYMFAAYGTEAVHSLDDIIAYVEQVADNLFQGASKAEKYKAVVILLGQMQEDNGQYYL